MLPVECRLSQAWTTDEKYDLCVRIGRQDRSSWGIIGRLKGPVSVKSRRKAGNQAWSNSHILEVRKRGILGAYMVLEVS